MTQPTEAVGGEAPVDLSPEDRLNAAFADPENHKEEEELAEGDEPEANDEPEIEADELPPIDAPVSWDAEAKERFAKLPREDQEYLSKRESERERFVQTKSQEAATARRDAEREALGQLATIEQGYAQHFQQLAQQLQPERPDPRLLTVDPAAFYARQAEYEATVAQRQQLQQQAEQFAQQAQQREAEAERHHHAEQHQQLASNFPEYLDPTTGPALQQSLSAVARELGYPPELIAQARASDILAMRKAAEWKAGFDQLQKLNKSKMEKVRAAKTLPAVSTPGAARAPGAARQQQYAADREAMKRGDKHATTRVLDSFFTQPK